MPIRDEVWGSKSVRLLKPFGTISLGLPPLKKVLMANGRKGGFSFLWPALRRSSGGSSLLCREKSGWEKTTRALTLLLGVFSVFRYKHRAWWSGMHWPGLFSSLTLVTVLDSPPGQSLPKEGIHLRQSHTYIDSVTWQFFEVVTFSYSFRFEPGSQILQPGLLLSL